MAKPPTYNIAPLDTPKASPAPAPTKAAAPERRTTMRDHAAVQSLYLHPEAVKALKRYAVDGNSRVHDLLVEAVEQWMASKGLNVPVKASKPD